MSHHPAVTDREDAALRRLLHLASGDTGQSRLAADFLLAWWNAATCGGFDLTGLWGVDDAIRADMVAVFGLVARRQHYPDTLGYAPEFGRVIASWRPHLV